MRANRAGFAWIRTAAPAQLHRVRALRLSQHTETHRQPHHVARAPAPTRRRRSRKKLPKGRYSTRKQVLDEMAGAHPVVPAVLAHRALKKRQEFVDQLVKQVGG